MVKLGAYATAAHGISINHAEHTSDLLTAGQELRHTVLAAKGLAGPSNDEVEYEQDDNNEVADLKAKVDALCNVEARRLPSQRRSM